MDWEEVFPRPIDASRRFAYEEEIELTPGRGMNKLFGAGNYKPTEYIKE